MTTETADALAAWCAVRSQVDWESTGFRTATRMTPAVDGLAAWFDGPVRRRDPDRADRLLAAWALVRTDAGQNEPLTPALLAGWQRLVLGVPAVSLRHGDAFAKGGRERYGLTSGTWRDFGDFMHQSADGATPLAARAARAYLDVAFFHPYPDGNARLALLTLAFVLEREGVRLDQVGPLQITRYADDPAGAADFAGLVAALIRATHRRAAATTG